jgi:protein O-mannosyl-transferase
VGLIEFMPSASASSPVLPARWLPRAAPWLLLLALLAVYWRSFDAPLLFDDAGAVVHNASIRQLATALHPPDDGSTTTGRPLLNLSYALNFALTGESVRGWHAGNFLLHVLAAVLLYALARRWLARPVLRSAGLDPDLAGLAVALLWALHPLLTESVVCIAQRSELLCGVCYLAVLFAFTRAAEAPAGSRNRWYAAAVGLAAAGMAAKEVMVTAPVLVWLVDRTFYAGGFAAAWRERRGFYAALAASWGVLVFLLVGSGGTRGSSAGLGLGVGVWPYLLQQAEAVVLYLRLSLWPAPLVLDYGTAVAGSLAAVWWQSLIVLLLLGGTTWALVKRPLLGLAGAAFFLILAPSSSFVPLVTQTMAEHRMYLPLAAVVMLAVALLGPRLGRARLPVVAGLALVAGGLTVARVGDYGSVLGIWQDSVGKYPRSARARLNLGVELLHAGRPAEARIHLMDAVALEPGYALARYNAGLAWQAEGKIPEALVEYAAAVRLAPENPDMQVNLGNALVLVGRAAEALPHYAEALRLKPSADVHFNRAEALIALGRSTEAADAWEAGVALEPAGPEWRRRAALGYAQTGRWSEAARHFAELVRLEPADAEAHANYGNVLLLSGQPSAAAREYEAALRLRPGDPQITENLGLARGAIR